MFTHEKILTKYEQKHTHYFNIYVVYETNAKTKLTNREIFYILIEHLYTCKHNIIYNVLLLFSKHKTRSQTSKSQQNERKKKQKYKRQKNRTSFVFIFSSFLVCFYISNRKIPQANKKQKFCSQLLLFFSYIFIYFLFLFFLFVNC